MIRVVIACGRDWTPGDPCRQATPIGVVDTIDQARTIAAREGWSTVVGSAPAGKVLVDRCPACTRRETEAARPRRRRSLTPHVSVPTDRPPPGASWEAAARDRVGRPLPTRPPGGCTLPCCLGRPWHLTLGRHA